MQNEQKERSACYLFLCLLCADNMHVLMYSSINQYENKTGLRFPLVFILLSVQCQKATQIWRKIQTPCCTFLYEDKIMVAEDEALKHI